MCRDIDIIYKNNALIGYTGFVGSNILLSKNEFKWLYNSKNIDDIVDKEFDIVICSGVSGTKFMANKYPEADMNNIMGLIDKLDKIKSVKKFVLISSVDVYPQINDVDENSIIDDSIKGYHFYGKNRLYLERFVEKRFDNYLIVRLPALYGENIKKNFIFDMIYRIPFLLKEETFCNLKQTVRSSNKNTLNDYYIKDIYNNYLLTQNIFKNKNDIYLLRKIFNEHDIFVEKFTDYRSKYQYYNLKNLWNDIVLAINEDIRLLNISTYPLSAKEIAKSCFNEEFTNELKNEDIVDYNIKSIYSLRYNGSDGYLYSKNSVIVDLKKYIDERWIY
ncbi:NAD dependent epimerase/dehydratase domain protein [Peptoanaerobacter stomatis]|uniref:NAD dependent epimerase/dehydratase domain protein n=1 Tax=Peptoanaerobacter stomatis TaxID=796937 RepID=J6HEK3_9FIRM|nr:NAD-dependent epimerase/dehydratase family protein [Peptoanaerobacter stomatis]EJU23470.1 NAD dependent epimerase/dehydratase domain protein [Peptoanaerobacter stomatis]NWO24572.1 NAD-dependent epimerase/dehydratase family protein [Peptostreptococcaceae bacterium oral taxon 081]